MVVKLITLAAMLFTAVIAQASDEAARSDAGCGLLKGNIFCFGGVRGNMTVSIATDTTMYMLDLSKNATMEDLSGNWTLIHPNTNGVNVETRLKPQFTTISDTQILYNGGFGGTANNVPIQDQTIVYDAQTNSWSKYANYAESPYGDRQIYYGTASFVPDKGAVFYGGFEEHVNTSWTINTSQNLTATYFSGNVSRVVGFVNAAFFNINQTNVWNVPTPQTNAPSVFSAFQSSVYSPFDKRVYYLGGTYQNTTVPGYQPSVFANWHPLSYALYFDTITNTWGNQSLGGSIKPTNRKSHTLTILPKDPTKILLYGGEDETKVASDFCFILDLTSFTWTQVNFSIPSDGSDLLRSRHNAITVGNDTLFMVFGLTSTGLTTSRPLAFNISSASTISYMSQYIVPASVGNANTNSTTASNATSATDSTSQKGSNSGSKTISGGAIAGIVIAIVAVAIIAAVAIFFYIRKQKKAKNQQKLSEGTKTGSLSLNHSQENIEVNWDEIEKRYVEVLPVESGIITKPDNSQTDVENSTSINSQSDGTVEKDIQHQANAGHNNVQTAVQTSITATPYLVMKPDGGHQ